MFKLYSSTRGRLERNIEMKARRAPRRAVAWAALASGGMTVSQSRRRQPFLPTPLNDFLGFLQRVGVAVNGGTLRDCGAQSERPTPKWGTTGHLAHHLFVEMPDTKLMAVDG